jgi:hypothetical protein
MAPKSGGSASIQLFASEQYCTDSIQLRSTDFTLGRMEGVVHKSQHYVHNAAEAVSAAQKAQTAMLNAEPAAGEQKIFQLYVQLASECFVRATAAKHADAVEVLMHMGNCYLARAHILDPSRVAMPSDSQSVT